MGNIVRSQKDNTAKDDNRNWLYVVGDIKLGKDETAYIVMSNGVLKQLANQSALTYEILQVNKVLNEHNERLKKLENPTK